MRCLRTSRGSARFGRTSWTWRTSRLHSTPLPDPSLLGRVGRTLAVAGSGMPYMLGLRRRRRTASDAFESAVRW